jgi:hypothetical protein
MRLTKSTVQQFEIKIFKFLIFFSNFKLQNIHSFFFQLYFELDRRVCVRKLDGPVWTQNHNKNNVKTKTNKGNTHLKNIYIFNLIILGIGALGIDLRYKLNVTN